MTLLRLNLANGLLASDFPKRILGGFPITRTRSACHRSSLITPTIFRKILLATLVVQSTRYTMYT
jgi:hypothetical protein